MAAIVLLDNRKPIRKATIINAVLAKARAFPSRTDPRSSTVYVGDVLVEFDIIDDLPTAVQSSVLKYTTMKPPSENDKEFYMYSISTFQYVGIPRQAIVPSHDPANKAALYCNHAASIRQ